MLVPKFPSMNALQDRFDTAVREHYKGVILDLYNEKLKLVDASNFDLTGSVMNNLKAKLCDFSRSDMSCASARKAHFRECDMSFSRWDSVDLAGARFERCDLRGADFRHAELDGAIFIDCDVRGCPRIIYKGTSRSESVAINIGASA